MGNHVIVGAGPVGTATAVALVQLGHEVTVVTRSGSGPEHPGVRRVPADASDPIVLARITAGADVLYNCANPPYHRWSELWPPLAASLLSAASGSEAGLVIMGNLYGYGPLDHPMTEDDQLVATGTKGRVRAAMWSDVLAAHRAGRVRVTEARASDFFGPGVVETSFFGRNVAALLAEKRIYTVGDPDVPHSWTYVPDVGRALAVLGTDGRAWGRPWHVPTAPPRSQREMAASFCEAAGLPAPRLSAVPGTVLWAAGVFSPQMREMRETRYQFDRPFVLDSSAFTATFGLDATPTDEGLRVILAEARSHQVQTVA
jgi:nucleoside-diphosphate-sugar epimerase